MYNLLRYLIRNGAFILFILCEVIAFYLIVQYNQGQKKIFEYSSHRFAANIYGQYDQLIQYFDLSKVSDSLAIENARLQERLYEMQVLKPLSGQETRTNRQDTLNTYTVFAAKVISNGVANRNNTIMLGAGAQDGLDKGMGILGQGGPAGIITNVTSNFASAISVLHSQSSVSARLKGSNYFGSLTWESANPKLMSLHAIPKHAPVSIGDTVETSGYSFTFPEGIMIGTIQSYRLPEGSNFYDIEVYLTYDVSKLDYVYVIKMNREDQLDSLQMTSQ